jgi:hypothetical protein
MEGGLARGGPPAEAQRVRHCGEWRHAPFRAAKARLETRRISDTSAKTLLLGRQLLLTRFFSDLAASQPPRVTSLNCESERRAVVAFRDAGAKSDRGDYLAASKLKMRVLRGELQLRNSNVNEQKTMKHTEEWVYLQVR